MILPAGQGESGWECVRVPPQDSWLGLPTSVHFFLLLWFSWSHTTVVVCIPHPLLPRHRPVLPGLAVVFTLTYFVRHLSPLLALRFVGLTLGQTQDRPLICFVHCCVPGPSWVLDERWRVDGGQGTVTLHMGSCWVAPWFTEVHSSAVTSPTSQRSRLPFWMCRIGGGQCNCGVSATPPAAQRVQPILYISGVFSNPHVSGQNFWKLFFSFHVTSNSDFEGCPWWSSG